MLYTSYYQKHGNSPLAVSISLFYPSFFRRRWYPDLAPTWEMIQQIKNGQIDQYQYTKRYMILLKERNLDPFKVVNDLEDNSILLCYEKPSDFCHRHIVAHWIQSTTGTPVVELAANKHINTLVQF